MYYRKRRKTTNQRYKIEINLNNMYYIFTTSIPNTYFLIISITPHFLSCEYKIVIFLFGSYIRIYIFKKKNKPIKIFREELKDFYL